MTDRPTTEVLPDLLRDIYGQLSGQPVREFALSGRHRDAHARHTAWKVLYHQAEFNYRQIAEAHAAISGRRHAERVIRHGVTKPGPVPEQIIAMITDLMEEYYE